MTTFRFQKSFDAQTCYAHGDVRISYNERIWPAILLHLQDRPGKIEPTTLREELFPALPLSACEAILEELQRNGYLQADENGNLSLTEDGQTHAAGGTYWRQLGAEHVVKLDVARIDEFNTVIEVAVTKDVYVEDAGETFRKAKEIKRKPVNAVLRAKNGQACTVDISAAKFKEHSNGSTTEMNVVLEIAENGARLLDGDGLQLAGVAGVPSLHKLLQAEIRGYDPARNAIRKSFGTEVLYEEPAETTRGVQLRVFESRGWRQKQPLQLAVIPQDETSARWAYLAALAQATTQIRNLQKPEPEFASLSVKLASTLSEAWGIPLQPVSLLDYAAVLDEYLPASFMRNTQPVTQPAWRARMVCYAATDLHPGAYDPPAQTTENVKVKDAIRQAGDAVFLQWPSVKLLVELEEEIAAAVRRGVRAYLLHDAPVSKELARLYAAHSLMRQATKPQNAAACLIVDPHRQGIAATLPDTIQQDLLSSEKTPAERHAAFSVLFLHSNQ